MALTADDAADRRAAALAASAGAAAASNLGHRERAFAYYAPHRAVGDSIAVADEHRKKVLGFVTLPRVEPMKLKINVNFKKIPSVGLAPKSDNS
jgi:hypothetical protein